MTGRIDLDQARGALDAHKGELLERFGAFGAGIGRDDSGDYCIRIYLDRGAAAPSPFAVDGVSVRFVVTGPIRPLEE